MNCNKNLPNNINVIIIGCGNIAGGYDELIHSEGLITHASVCAHKDNFKIVCCIDPDKTRLEEFSNKWSIENKFQYFDPDLINKFNCNLAIISSPTHTHNIYLSDLVDTNIDIVVCEKPLTDDHISSQKIFDKYKKCNKPLIVNYSRCWNKNFIQLKKDIINKKLGQLKNITCHYMGGLYCNASHIINLLYFLFGSIELIKVNSLKKYNDDFLSDFILKIDDSRANFFCYEIESFGIFEIRIYMDRAIVSIEDWGRNISIRLLQQDPLSLHRKNIPSVNTKETDYKNEMLSLYTEIEKYLMYRKEMINNLDGALLTDKICKLIINESGMNI